MKCDRCKMDDAFNVVNVCGKIYTLCGKCADLTHSFLQSVRDTTLESRVKAIGHGLRVVEKVAEHNSDSLDALTKRAG